ncbi:hypothetical protein [Anderseniella sp. Alg231-50]|uniref:hypothetical protein n=1 Tax=Anderseniella sp. Alg231-50 TaxID=1922226 RepID=UPI000D55D23F
MERRHLTLLLAGLALVITGPLPRAEAQSGHFYYFGHPGYNPYQYPYPDRDGYARFDLNCVGAAKLLREDGFRVIDAIRCKRHLPFVYLAVRDRKRYRVTISQFDGEILDVVRADPKSRKKRKKRRKRRNK